MENLKFGEVIEGLKDGKKYSRKGWNGKDMFIVKAGGYTVSKDKLLPVNGTNGTISPDFLNSKELEELVVLPHIDLWTAQNTYLVGWHATQTDIFAEDWYEIIN